MRLELNSSVMENLRRLWKCSDNILPSLRGCTSSSTLPPPYFLASCPDARPDSDACFGRLGDATVVCEAYGSVGTLCEKMGRHEEALEVLTRQWRLAQKINDVNQQALAMANLGSIFETLERHDEALSLFEANLSLCQNINDPSGQKNASRRLCELYRKLDRHDKAINLLSKPVDCDAPNRPCKLELDPAGCEQMTTVPDSAPDLEQRCSTKPANDGVLSTEKAQAKNEVLEDPSQSWRDTKSIPTDAEMSNIAIDADSDVDPKEGGKFQTGQPISHACVALKQREAEIRKAIRLSMKSVRTQLKRARGLEPQARDASSEEMTLHVSQDNTQAQTRKKGTQPGLKDSQNETKIARKMDKYCLKQDWERAIALEETAMSAAMEAESCNPKLALALYGRLANVFEHVPNRSMAAMQAHERVMWIAHTLQDTRVKAAAHACCVKCCFSLSDLGSTASALSKHMQVLEELDDSRLQFDTGLQLAGIHERLGNYEQTILLARKALPFAKKLQDLSAEGSLLALLARSLAKTGLHYEATRVREHAHCIHTQAIQQLTRRCRMGPLEEQADACAKLAVVYQEMGRHSESIDMRSKAKFILARSNIDNYTERDHLEYLDVVLDGFQDEYSSNVSSAEEGVEEEEGTEEKQQNEMQMHPLQISTTRGRVPMDMMNDSKPTKLQNAHQETEPSATQASKLVGIRKLSSDSSGNDITWHQIPERSDSGTQSAGTVAQVLQHSQEQSDKSTWIKSEMSNSSRFVDESEPLAAAAIYSSLGIALEQQAKDSENQTECVKLWTDAIDMHQASRIIALKITDLDAESNACSHLAAAYTALERYEEAIDMLHRCLQLAETKQNPAGQSEIHGKLGNVYFLVGRFPCAIRALNRQLELTEAIGDVASTAASYGNLGAVYALLNQDKKAISMFRRHLPLANELGDLVGQAQTFLNMATSFEKLHQTENAIECLRRAYRLMQHSDDPIGHAEAAGRLGRALVSDGQLDQSILFLTESLDLFEANGLLPQQGQTLQTVGMVSLAQGKYSKASESLIKAKDIAERLKKKEVLGKILSNLGIVKQRLGHLVEAVELHARAQTIAVEVGDLHAQANCAGNLGTCYHKLNRQQEALEALEALCDLAVQLQDEDGLIHAYVHMGTIYREMQRHIDAADMFTKVKQMTGDVKNVVGDQAQSRYAIHQMQYRANVTRQKGLFREEYTIPEEFEYTIEDPLGFFVSSSNARHSCTRETPASPDACEAESWRNIMAEVSCTNPTVLMSCEALSTKEDDKTHNQSSSRNVKEQDLKKLTMNCNESTNKTEIAASCRAPKGNETIFAKNQRGKECPDMNTTENNATLCTVDAGLIEKYNAETRAWSMAVALGWSAAKREAENAQQDAGLGKADAENIASVECDVPIDMHVEIDSARVTRRAQRLAPTGLTATHERETSGLKATVHQMQQDTCAGHQPCRSNDLPNSNSVWLPEHWAHQIEDRTPVRLQDQTTSKPNKTKRRVISTQGSDQSNSLQACSLVVRKISHDVEETTDDVLKEGIRIIDDETLLQVLNCAVEEPQTLRRQDIQLEQVDTFWLPELANPDTAGQIASWTIVGEIATPPDGATGENVLRPCLRCMSPVLIPESQQSMNVASIMSFSSTMQQNTTWQPNFLRWLTSSAHSKPNLRDMHASCAEEGRKFLF